MVRSSALLHPVRLRIVQSLLAHETSTPKQLHEHLGDVPIATLYRHVGALAELGLIEVADEQQIRGASEKSYRLAAGFANPSPAELRAMSPGELLTAFTVFTSGLIRDFDAYLGEPGYDLSDDRVAFAQAGFWASDAEVDAFTETLTTALRALMQQGPEADRRRRVLTTVLLPQPGSHTPTPSAHPTPQERNAHEA